MKKSLIAASLSGMLIPAFAYAEFNYNTVDAGYSVTGDYPALTELDVGISKSISEDAYIMASYGTASLPDGAYKANLISLGGGYHTPLKDNVDAIVKGRMVQGSAEFSGTSAYENGYDISVGVRALFRQGVEGTLALVHASASNGTFTSKDTFINVQLGFNFIPEFQMTAGMDFKPVTTTSLGVRIFY